jgi:D-beta-D-heptose 7-phosphate kinase/D-beta-D-heptose 1-phosphate adenosyltransferase
MPSWAHARDTVEGWRRQGLRIVFTNGCFDLLHPGHLAYLTEAKALGDRLVIGLNDDGSIRRLKGPTRPVNPLADRTAMLEALRMVDLVVPFSEDTPLELIQTLRPDILVKGGDYRPETIVGAEEVRGWGGEVVVIPFLDGHSSSGLIARIRSL